MLVPSIIMGVIAVVLLIIGYQRGHQEHITGLQSAFTMTWQILPMLIFAFIIAGMVQVLIPKESLSQWVGAESGMRGIFIGAIAGAFTPGGPYVSLPIVAGLLNAGAGIGTMVAFMTGWSLWAVGRIPMELGILGWKFTVIRLVSTLIFPPLAGILANLLFSNARL